MVEESGFKSKVISMGSQPQRHESLKKYFMRHSRTPGTEFGHGARNKRIIQVTNQKTG